jgi:hypothetical protein
MKGRHKKGLAVLNLLFRGVNAAEKTKAHFALVVSASWEICHNDIKNKKIKISYLHYYINVSI